MRKSALENAVDRLRANLIAQDTRTLARISNAYQTALNSVEQRLSLLLDAIQKAQDSGETITPGWFAKEQRLRSLQSDIRQEINKYRATVIEETTSAQERAINRATEDAFRLTQSAMATVTVSWNRVPVEAFTDLVGALSDGSPLSSLVANYGEVAAKAVKDALYVGMAQGINPRSVQRMMRDSLSGLEGRGRSLARTETLRAYRSATLRNYEANSDVVRGWVWMASLSARTCASCLAMHGSVHPTSERMGTHPNCRCVCAPFVSGSPVVQTSQDWLEGQPQSVQDSILGKGADGWREGRYRLSDFVHQTESPLWGVSRTARTPKV
jgi:SPP1 gp7 family putative phage head morphogenesis protein